MTNLLSSPELEPLLQLAQEMLRRIYSGESAEEVRSWLREQLQLLEGRKQESACLLWDESFALYDKIMAGRKANSLLPEEQRKTLLWPWLTWNKLIDPLDPGMLAVVAAGDGQGKTACAECISEYWAKCGYNVVYLHFELNQSLMLDRRMARHSNITRRILKIGLLTPEQQIEFQSANQRLRSFPGSVTYVHTPEWTVERSLAEIRRLTDDGLCDVFVIDYLEKASTSSRQIRTYGTNIFAKEANDVEQIKSFAEQQAIPALLLSQLNKMGKSQQFSNLDKQAIRGAGEKTEKANVVILLYRENSETNILQVRIDKNTMGQTGSFTQFMNGARFLIMDLLEEEKTIRKVPNLKV